MDGIIAHGDSSAQATASGEFADRVWRCYEEHGRGDLPWRCTTDPYHVLVSEVMLQQTQVARVTPKYEAFVREFPTVESLAAAPLDRLLGVWRGLGYNRRALALKRAAEIIVTEHGGAVPRTLDALTSLPGVGHATAAQVLAFAFDVGVPFIETNIRSVYLHEFFPDVDGVPDSAILPLVEATLDTTRPREWFWALLDYGAHLKTMTANPSRRSRHHTRQSRFEGSNRQLRGRILAALAGQPSSHAQDDAAGAADAPPGVPVVMDADELTAAVGFESDRVVAALEKLQAEGFVASSAEGWRLG